MKLIFQFIERRTCISRIVGDMIIFKEFLCPLLDTFRLTGCLIHRLLDFLHRFTKLPLFLLKLQKQFLRTTHVTVCQSLTHCKQKDSDQHCTGSCSCKYKRIFLYIRQHKSNHGCRNTCNDK